MLYFSVHQKHLEFAEAFRCEVGCELLARLYGAECGSLTLHLIHTLERILQRARIPLWSTGARGNAREDIVRGNKISKLTAIAVLWTISATQSQAQDAWGAFTACCVPGNGGCEAVSTGFGSGPSQEAAKKGAYDQAFSDVNPSSPWKCNSVRVFNRGCAYIAEGCSERTKRCGWAIGNSEDEAMRKLKSQGYSEGASRGGGCIGQ